MELNLQDAWNDFESTLKQSGRWKELTRKQREYIYRTKIEIKRGAIPVRRVRGLFDRYAPGVYQFKEAIFTKSETTCKNQQ